MEKDYVGEYNEKGYGDYFPVYVIEYMLKNGLNTPICYACRRYLNCTVQCNRCHQIFCPRCFGVKHLCIEEVGL